MGLGGEMGLTGHGRAMGDVRRRVEGAISLYVTHCFKLIHLAYKFSSRISIGVH